MTKTYFLTNEGLLTLNYDQGWVEQEVAHQLSSQLAEQATGDCPIKNHILILHHIHQSHWWRAPLLGHTLDLCINIQTHFNILFQSTNNYVSQRGNIRMCIIFFIYSKHINSQHGAHV